MTNYLRLAIIVLTINFQFSIFNLCYGQITISQTDMPQPGDTIRLSTCNSNANLPNPTLTGANFT
jgi:hypothetical protein